MKQEILEWITSNKARAAIIIIIPIIIIVMSLSGNKQEVTQKELTPQELEQKLKQEIAALDTKRVDLIKNIDNEINAKANCRNSLSAEKGTTSPIKSCDEYNTKHIIPEAKASNTETKTESKENTGTATGASNPVPERGVSRLKPSELLGPVKLSDDCYVTQTETEHVRVENGGMFATDLACKFGVALGKGGKAELYVPDLRGKETEYKVEYVGFDNLLGSFIQIVTLDGKESFYLGHTETKLKVGDKVKTGERIGQMILNGATTGWHVHFEYRAKTAGGAWASQRYFTGLREKTLDNKRKNVTYNGWKWGDEIYATGYTLGDVKQNDSSPWVGASGKNLQGIQNVVALTKDVRRSLNIKFGDIIIICQGNNCNEVQVEDEMNARYRETGPKDCIKPNSGENACIKMDMARPNNQLPSGVWKLLCKKNACSVG